MNEAGAAAIPVEAGSEKEIAWLRNVIRILDKVGVFSRWTNVIGVAFLFLMVGVTVVDVVLRYVFNMPIKGALEITEVMMIVAVFLAVAHTQNEKAHISIDLVASKLRPKARLVLQLTTNLLSIGLFAAITWQILAQTMWFVQRNTMHSQYMNIPSAPFAAVITLGSTALSLLLIRDFLVQVVEARRIGLSWRHWLLVFGIVVIFVALAIAWMQPGLIQLSLPTVGLIGVVFSLVLFMSGMPISFSLILTALLFVSHIRGMNVGLDMLGAETYRNTGSYQWAVLTFFVIMGYFCLHSRLSDDLYYSADKWVGNLRGGLAIATVGACAGFAAIVGDSVSAVATMGAVSLPEMKKYRYDNLLSSGAICAGASLGPIIPPSVPFILYGILTQMSIGDLFIAGVVPGLVLAIAFAFTIYVWCRIKPQAGPRGVKSGWKTRIFSLKAAGPVFVLFILVIGGIYAGVFTPSEGGAIGAGGAFIIGLLMGRYTWKRFFQSLLDSGKMISMVFLILIGAVMFTRFTAWTNLSATVTSAINGLNLPPLGVVAVLLFIIFILGFFVDIMPLMLVGIPILHPIAVAQGMNPIWFAVLLVLVINVGALTPPVGINLFALKGVSKDMPVGTIYRGVLPFVVASAAVILIVFFVPSLATWLPNLFK